MKLAGGPPVCTKRSARKFSFFAKPICFLLGGIYLLDSRLRGNQRIFGGGARSSRPPARVIFRAHRAQSRNKYLRISRAVVVSRDGFLSYRAI
jgi:hypothetical protein